MVKVTGLAAALVAMCAISAPATAALTAYYTLNDTSSGLQNAGTDGSTSNLSLVGGKTAGTPVSGVIGDAIQFSNTVYRTTTTSDAADDLSTYPFTLSFWMKTNTGGVGMGISAVASSNRYFYAGIGSNKGIVSRRNTSQVSASGSANLNDGSWHQITGVFASNTEMLLYVDGKYAATSTDSVNFNDNSDALSLGAVIRTNGGVTEYLSQFSGDLDDAGLFSTALSASDVALINGLGQTSGLGLDWLDEAQALNDSALDTTLLINGVEARRVSGLIGAIGDYGGTMDERNAYIITGPGGNGVALPEPAMAGTFLCLGAMFLRRTKVRI